jgi:hypothetical protein
MRPKAWFQVANTIALTGWLALAFSPLAPRLLGLLGGIAMPLLLSGGYTAIVLVHWASGQEGFDGGRRADLGQHQSCLGHLSVSGRDARTPVHIAALVYIRWVAATFIQALIGQPFLAGIFFS